MQKKKYFLKILCLFTLSASVTACGEGLSISPTYDGGIIIKAAKKTPPRIISMDYYPKSTSRKDDIITFTVDAANKTGDLLQYSWKCSKGTLLSNSGNTVNWKPERGDGTLESGTATITVTVSDGSNTADASANVIIYTDGRVSGGDHDYNPYPESTPTPYRTPYPRYTPTPYPTANIPDYDYDDNYYPGHYQRVLFEEDFEHGYLDDQWSVSYQGTNRTQYLTWKKVADDSRSNNTVVNLSGPTDDVLADTCSTEVRLTSQAIDLRDAKLPRLNFETKSFANPTTAVKLNIYWSHEGRTPRSMNVSFIPDKNWDNVDLDLSNLLSEQGGSVGLLSIGAIVCNNKNEFKGPMIDNIIIYDSAVK
jgi:hypothetical protein